MMNILVNTVEKILGKMVLAQDKLAHYFYGSIIAAIGGLYSVWFGLVLCTVIAILKECYDALVNHLESGDWKSGPHSVDIMDVVFTVFGGIVVSIGRLI